VPVVIVAFALFYFEDVGELIKGREVKVLGVEIGPAVAQLQETTEQELDDLQALVAELEANFWRELEAAGAREPSAEASSEPLVSEETREAAQAVETKFSSLRANLDREAQALREVTVQQALPDQTALSPGPVQITPMQPAARADEAAAFEQAGFEAILDRRLDDAIAAFERARGMARLSQRGRDRRLPRPDQGERGAARCRRLGGRSRHPDQIFLGHARAPARRVSRRHRRLELNRRRRNVEGRSAARAHPGIRQAWGRTGATRLGPDRASEAIRVSSAQPADWNPLWSVNCFIQRLRPGGLNIHLGDRERASSLSDDVLRTSVLGEEI
jgi:hypothetical protein